MRTFGDSITAGLSASPIANAWVNLFAPINHAVSAAQAADMANTVQTVTPNIDETYYMMIGTNDIYKYKTDALKQGYFKQFLRHALAWVALPEKVTAQAMTLTGSWWNVGVNSFGKACSTNGNTATATVTGDKVFVGFIIQDNALTLGVGKVEIDDVEVGQFACNGAGMVTVLGATYAGAALCFDVAQGTHTVKVTATSPTGKYFYLNYIAGNSQPSPKIAISNIIKWADAGYTANGLSSSITSEYNALINCVLADLPCVDLIDNYSDIVPALHLSADGVHPNNAGHLVIHNNFKQG